MKIDLLIQSKISGNTLSVANNTQSINLELERTGSAGKLDFTINKAGDLSFHEGDPVLFCVDSKKLFFGYVFTKSKDRYGVIKVTCYDQLRYLLAKGSYVFDGYTAGQIIQRIAADFELNVGEIADTGCVLPAMIKSNKSCLDIISYAVQYTTYLTGKIYVFYDDCGALTLKPASELMDNRVIGTKSLLGNYTYKTDISKETYNRIKLVQLDSETGAATKEIVVQNGEMMNSWGVLQLYQTIDEDSNDAQIQSQGLTMLQYYGRVLRTLSIDSLGIVGLRAGAMIFVNVPDLGDISLSKFVLIDKISHSFTNDYHTMSITTRALDI